MFRETKVLDLCPKAAKEIKICQLLRLNGIRLNITMGKKTTFPGFIQIRTFSFSLIISFRMQELLSFRISSSSPTAIPSSYPDAKFLSSKSSIWEFTATILSSSRYFLHNTYCRSELYRNVYLYSIHTITPQQQVNIFSSITIELLQ